MKSGTRELQQNANQSAAMPSKVLIIDDEEDVCTILTLFLKQKKCVVDCSNTLKDGIEKVKDFDPDVVFLDHMLPDGEGVSAIGTIKQLKPSVRVIMISGMGEMNAKAMHAGAELFIKKPFRLKEILESLEINH